MGKSVKISKKRIALYVFYAFLIIWLIVGFYAKFKVLPEGISIEGSVYNVSDDDIEFLYDLNYVRDNESVIEQEIFDEVFRVIDMAEDFIVIDMFLFNTDYSEKVRYKNLTTDMKNLLIEKKIDNPAIEIVFITDPINNFYGSYTSDELIELRENNISVVVTELNALRDVNLIYSGFWRAYLQWFGTGGDGWISHPLGNIGQKVTLRSFLKLMNTKANHRKVIVADQGDRIVSIVTSANPHEASSKHSNVGVKVYGSLGEDVLMAESAVERFSSDYGTVDNILGDLDADVTTGNIQVQLLTEEKIRDSLLEEIGDSAEGDKIEMIMFYLSDRKIVNALLEASERGVEIELILDPNKDAFAREKSGIPNRQVAWELVKKSDGKINVRWYDTNGEQQHSKIVVIRKADGSVIILLGSANLTKRNIGNFNLEMNVKIISPEGTKIETDVGYLFDRLWNNENGHFTTEFETYKDTSLRKYWQYRIQEATGFSSF
ncbi:phospholipase [Candidatus Pacearchaeota archaeon]|nr:phospholipase [Candidatus Pacearchaeota archaeon]|tara:strand:- start:7679 stop:9148 length:1470 start_codon:yes stop_codon:yes gene_type:complete